MLKKILIDKINKSFWWHTPPRDPNAHRKRGKFLASTYLQAEFYGRPNMEPEKVRISNPIFGFSEEEILEQIFTGMGKKILKSVENIDSKNWYNKRIALDGKIYRQAKKMGYDAVVLMTSEGKKSLERNHKPRSMELNLLKA